MSNDPALIDRSLSDLIGSRICHDLISPIGAIGNGLEASLIEDAEKLHRRERARQLTFCQTIQNKQ